MSSKNIGNYLEQVVEWIEGILQNEPNVSIVRNAKLVSTNGVSRQIDILIKHIINRFEYITIIECKNHKRKVDINTFQAFKELVSSLNAHQGIIVSASGFQNGAIKEAKAAKNIFLYEFSKMKDIAQHFKEYQLFGHTFQHVCSNVQISYLTINPIDKSEIDINKTPIIINGNEFIIMDVIKYGLDANKNDIIVKLIDENQSVKQDEDYTISGESALNIIFEILAKVKGKDIIINGLSVKVKTTLNKSNFAADESFTYHDVTNEKSLANVYTLNINGIDVTAVSHIVDK